MKPARSLTLHREHLTDLTPSELSSVAAGEAPTEGAWCARVVVATAVIAAATAIIETFQGEQPQA